MSFSYKLLCLKVAFIRKKKKAFDTKQCIGLGISKGLTALDLGCLNYHCKLTIILLKACYLYSGILIWILLIVKFIMLMRYHLMLRNVRVIYIEY